LEWLDGQWMMNNYQQYDTDENTGQKFDFMHAS
jgi:hypothetical protein